MTTVSKATKSSKVFNKVQYLKKLIRELRSGKYEQIEGTLRGYGTDQFCLWGLGCEVYRQDYNSCEWNGDELLYTPDDWQEQLWQNPDLSLNEIQEIESSELPPFIANQLGTTRAGHIKISKTKSLSTIYLNDAGISFEGLAAILEVYPFVSTTTHHQPYYFESSLEKKLETLFSKTKLAKNWRSKGVRPDSDLDNCLMEIEESREEKTHV